MDKYLKAESVFVEYRNLKSKNTLRAQDSDLQRFSDYLDSMNVPCVADLSVNPDSWQGITWGLIIGFRQWLLREGYAVGSVNRIVSTVKKYATLAFQSGMITTPQHEKILQISSYSNQEAKRIDKCRDITRVGYKKSEHTRVTEKQAEQLKHGHEDTPQGRRDALLMCLLIDHGLRVGEMALLQVEHVNTETGELEFYRPKVNKDQKHQLSGDTLAAVRRWLDVRGTNPGALLLSTRKDGVFTHAGMTENALRKRVRRLGDAIGLDHLSPHDLRHYWATYWSKRINRLPRGLFTLQEAGGWDSLSMLRQYVDFAEIANEGMKTV